MTSLKLNRTCVVRRRVSTKPGRTKSTNHTFAIEVPRTDQSYMARSTSDIRYILPSTVHIQHFLSLQNATLSKLSNKYRAMNISKLENANHSLWRSFHYPHSSHYQPRTQMEWSALRGIRQSGGQADGSKLCEIESLHPHQPCS
jgi:hypothetical protein